VRVITSIDGLLRTLSDSPVAKVGRSGSDRTLTTGLPAIDGLLPGGAFAAGAIHEVLSDTDTPAYLLPILLAKSATRFGRIVWTDAGREFYPPVAAALGLPLNRFLVLRPASAMDELWAATECLQCKGVGACVTPVWRLSRVQARRLQLAAERGGGIGILLRPASAMSRPYAAATRWLVKPAMGERTIQRWSIELLHGHGGRIGQNVLLEMHRETHHVRAIDAVADRPDQAQTVTASA
jgi:protein ImuA